MKKIVISLVAMLALVNVRTAAQAPFGQYSRQPWEAKYYQTHADSGETPGDDWYKPEFDDSEWGGINGPISNTGDTYCATPWEPEEAAYWVRRHFTMGTIDADKIYTMHVIHDDGCVMYLNGHLIYENGGVRSETGHALIFNREQLAYLKEGDNLLAVKVGNTGRGNAFMDFGIYACNPVSELTLSHDIVSVRKGTHMSIEALLNEDAYDKSLSWSIADGNVASVSAEGVISGHNVGHTTLTVTSVSNPEVSATCQIYVYEPDTPQWILPWGKDEAWAMRYRHYELDGYEGPAVDANGKRWTDVGYDDAAWETLNGPMASEGISYSSYNYVWVGENNCFCLRRTFTMSVVDDADYTFLMQHDDDIKVYLNGQLAVEESGWTDERVSIYPIPSDAFVEGENTLAIYIQQNQGGAFLDYAIEAEVKATRVTLSEENLTLKINEEAQLNAVVDGTTSTIAWSVADNTVAWVTQEGKVRGRKAGTTTVTATAMSDPSITATCTVTVTSEYAPMVTGWLQSMGEEYPWTMRYQFYELADSASPATDGKGLHWYEVGYDDAEWKTLVGPLGSNTAWVGDNNCYYLRGTFVLPEDAHGSLRFYAKHDDGIHVYVNGVLVREHGYDMGLHDFVIPDTLLHLGENTIAVYAQEEGGEAYFDYGLYYTQQSTCTVTVVAEEGGTVTGGGEYAVGTEVTLTAVPDAGYRFVAWSDGSIDNTVTIIVNGDMQLTAIFEKIPVIAPGTILPWGKDEAWTVKYLFHEVADSERPGVDAHGEKWYESNYDDSSWGTLTGPIGDKNDYNYLWVGENNCFFLRRTFHLSEIEDKSLSFYVNHDNGIEVYLNGQLVVKNEDWTHDKISLYKISNEALVIGENTLAIYIKQEEGSTYLDYTLLFEDTRQQEELYDSRIVSIPEGVYYVYYTDRDGNRRYLQAAGEDNWVVGDRPTVMTFSEGNVTDIHAYAHAASFMESNGYYMSVVKDPDGIGPISTAEKDGEIGLQKRAWESQVLYRNEAGKYAIRLTNSVGAEWKNHYFVNVNSITLDVAAGTPTLGEEFYIWNIEKVDYTDPGLVAIPEGYYHVFYTDSLGVRQYLYMADFDYWAVDKEVEVMIFSDGNVTAENAFAPAASIMEYDGYYMSNVESPDGTGPINTVDKLGELGVGKRTWESQVFYRNEAGKYAIRLTNTTGTSWGCHLFANVDPQTLKVVAADPSLGDALYIWELEQTDSVPDYDLKKVTANALHGGIVKGGGKYAVGTEVTLTAVPDAGYHFVGWAGKDWLENPYTFVVEQNIAFTAEFAPDDKPEVPDHSVPNPGSPRRFGAITT